MKKEEAIKKLSNTKVYVDGKSEEVQKKLFELGFMWASGSRVVDYISKPFIFISANMLITTSSDMLYFKHDKSIECKADYILSITIDKEYEFKPFDRVLVRDYDSADWNADFFSHIRQDEDFFKFKTIGSSWVYCIPFEGNEHLIGTSKSPDKV